MNESNLNVTELLPFDAVSSKNADPISDIGRDLFVVLLHGPAPLSQS